MPRSIALLLQQHLTRIVAILPGHCATGVLLGQTLPRPNAILLQQGLPRHIAVLLQQHLPGQIAILFCNVLLPIVLANVRDGITLDRWAVRWLLRGALIVVIVRRFACARGGRWDCHTFIVPARYGT